ncbi:MAG: NAD(P)-dependent oxidoreductase [Bacteroidota bacterium]
MNLESKSKVKNIGFIGLGIMGSRMAAHLLTPDFKLKVYNRSSEKAQKLVEGGATPTANLSDLAQGSDIIITMLSTPEVVRDSAFGNNGFIQKMDKGGIWINCSTVNPTFSEEMCWLAQQSGVRFIDAPVAGTKGPAEAGELLFLLGGEAEDIEEVAPLFELMGKKYLRLGKAGKGSAMKMLINQLLAQSTVAFVEAMVLGEAMGLKQETLFNVLTATPVVAPVISGIRPKLESGDYDPNFSLKWIHKDLHLSSLTAYEKEVPLHNLGVTKELFGQAKQNGFGDMDFSSIYEFMRNKESDL